MEGGGKRAVCIWHRRAGKDVCALNYIATAAVERVAVYWHLLPTYNQARKIIWDGKTREGRKFLDFFPPELRASENATEMKLTLSNQSIYQAVGTDNIDRLVGTNVVGAVFSEYSLQDPRAWDLIRPILVENGGWAMFIYTPRGKNHGYDMFNMANRIQEEKGSWFSQLLTVDDTGVVTADQVQEERDAGMSEEMIQQEFYCSFSAGLIGAYFLQQMDKAKAEGRIGRVQIVEGVPVDTWWDLGMDDATTIWFTQTVGREIHVIDYYEASGEGLAHYATVLADKKARYKISYGIHMGPHDITVRELGTGKSRLETARTMGINFSVAPRPQKKEDSIEAARSLIQYCWFDSSRCARGIETLLSYRKEYSEKNKVYTMAPVHDWSSHGADAFQTLALAHSFRRIGAHFTPNRREESPAGVVANKGRKFGDIFRVKRSYI
jgi:hypothetical protein